jgi:hypothetical protein
LRSDVIYGVGDFVQVNLMAVGPPEPDDALAILEEISGCI